MAQSEKGWLEHREYTRVRDVLKIVYYPIEGTGSQTASSDDYKDTTIEKLAADRSRNTYIKAMTEDISKGGLSILTDKPLALNQHVIIDLFLPRIMKPIKLLAEVRNIESTSKASFKAGLKIISISKSDLSRIENHLAGRG